MEPFRRTCEYRTDLPLTATGEAKAAALRPVLAGKPFALVLTSPLQRARRTCEIAGFGAVAQIDPNLCEWDYGAYEGRTSAEIHKDRPAWDLFRDGVPDSRPSTMSPRARKR